MIKELLLLGTHHSPINRDLGFSAVSAHSTPLWSASFQVFFVKPPNGSTLKKTMEI